MQVRMNIRITMRVMNGCGDSVRDGMKRSLMDSLYKQSGGNIESEMGGCGFRESFPNNGWSGFDYIINAPIVVNVDRLVKNTVPGPFAHFGSKFLSNVTGYDPVAKIIRSQLDAAIRQNLAEADWTGFGASLNGVEVTLR